MSNKYHARRTELDGHIFDSIRESQRYAELVLLARAGQIRNLRLQPEYVLQEAFTDSAGKRHRKIVYRADFAYEEDGRACVEDLKGYSTAVFKLKKKLFLYHYPEHELRITK